MKRYVNPSLILGLFLFLGVLIFAPIQHAEAQAGVPWVGLFYPSTDFTGTVQSTTYNTGLSVNWGGGPPTDTTTGQALIGIPSDGFSARFSSNTTIQGGLYEFIVVVDGGVRLQINNQTLINDLGNNGLRTYSVIVNLSTGAYLLVLDYIEYTGNALVQVNWITTTGTPTAGGGGSAPLAVGEVVQVRGLALRSGPFLGATLLGVARPGGAYNVLAKNTQEGLFTWYYIQFDEDTWGWVSGRYFAITEGDPANLPIRDATDFTTIYDPPGLVTGITRSNMNFRVLPTQRALRIENVPQLEWGAYVEILARTRQGGRDFWYMVRYTVPNTDTSYVGWIFAPYVDVCCGSDPIDTVPRL